MRFWDSSALVALFVEQRSTARVRDLYAADAEILAWTLSDVELRSALARLERERVLSPDVVHLAVHRIEAFWESVHVVGIVDGVKARAKRLVGVHVLRSADALQLGAALLAAGDDVRALEFTCLDARLCDAARREGFVVLP